MNSNGYDSRGCNVDVNDAQAIYNLACDNFNGDYGVPRDRDNALTLWRRAAELGCSAAHYNIDNAYRNGEIIGKDMKKVGAMGYGRRYKCKIQSSHFRND